MKMVHYMITFRHMSLIPRLFLVLLFLLPVVWHTSILRFLAPEANQQYRIVTSRAKIFW